MNESDKAIKRPLSFLAAKWYSHIFAAMFVLYGGVKIILGVLDRNYDGFELAFFFLILGIILMTISFAFRDARPWGWYALVALNAIVLVLTLTALQRYGSIILLMLSGLQLLALFLPTTKSQVFKH